MKPSSEQIRQFNTINYGCIDMNYTFKWRETTITDHDVTLTRDEIIGTEVWYQPTGSQGIIKEENGVLFIEWSDIDEDTCLDSKVGQAVMLECEVW